MALKIKLKLGGSGGGGGGSNGAPSVPADDATSTSSPRPKPSTPTVSAVGAAPIVQRPKIKLVRSDPRPMPSTPAVPAAGAAPAAHRPKIKLVRSDVKVERAATPTIVREMPPPALPALARVKAEPSPTAFPLSPLGVSSPLPSSPGTPRSDDDNPASDDTIHHDPGAPLPPPGPPGPRVPALGASAASGKKLVGGRLQLPFIDVLEKMLKELKRRDAYGFFLNPGPSGWVRGRHLSLLRLIARRPWCPFFIVSDADAPGYSAVITQPMDFTTMTRKAHTGEYKSFDEFEVSPVGLRRPPALSQGGSDRRFAACRSTPGSSLPTASLSTNPSRSSA